MPETSIEWLIEDLYVKLGFCLPTEAQAQLLEDTPSTAEEFATAVFSAEGIDPDQQRGVTALRRRRRIVRRVGPDPVRVAVSGQRRTAILPNAIRNLPGFSYLTASSKDYAV